jgi:hypothetical protein
MRRLFATIAIGLAATVIPTGATIGLSAAANSAQPHWASCTRAGLTEPDGGVATFGPRAYICDGGQFAVYTGVMPS